MVIERAGSADDPTEANQRAVPDRRPPSGGPEQPAEPAAEHDERHTTEAAEGSPEASAGTDVEDSGSQRHPVSGEKNGPATDRPASGTGEAEPTRYAGERNEGAADGKDAETPDSPLEHRPSHGGFATLADEFDARRQSRQYADALNAEADRSTRVERSDKLCEVKPPQIVGDYYPNIPPTTQDRYFVRDRSNPVPVFDGPPSREQAVQGRIGDCGIVATLGAVAGHRPEAIQNAIKQIGDGRYEITLHEVSQATPADPVARPTGDTTTYRVNDDLPVQSDDPARPLVGVGAESCGWAALMEKVIAAEDQTWDPAKKTDWDKAWTTTHKSAVDLYRAKVGLGASPDDAPMGYNRLDIGSTAYQRADLLARLTGEKAEVHRIPGEEHGEQALLDAFRDQLNAGKPVLVGTRGRASGEVFPGDIVPGHAYEVTKIENNMIHLRNPWGELHPDPMDATTFWEYYRWYNSDGTRDGHYTTLG